MTSNHITTAGFAYDAAGNQTRALIPGSSSSQRYQYDAANRLVKVKADDNVTVLASYIYGDSNERLIADEGGVRTYYVSEGGATIAEYTESGDSIFPAWSKGYVYLGGRLLATLTPNNLDGESIQFHHPDRLGTRIVTNPANGTFFEQQTLPFGTALNESPPTGGTTDETNRRFTSYDRSPTTKLDYAVNRHYDPQQGRFTQVDPIGMQASSLSDPQSFNMYSYVGNDPVNRMDPTGLFWGKLWRAIKKIVTSKWFQIALAVAIIVIAHYYPNSIFGFLSGSSSASSGAAGAAAAPVLQTAATGAGAVAARAAAIAATNAAFAAGGIAALEGATLGLSLTVDLVSLGLAGALAAGQIGGAFTSAQQTELNKVENNVKQRLQNPQCAGVLGGLQKALALFNQALVLHANTINPAFGGSARAFRSVARQALAIANNSKSHLLAWSEIGGKYVYLNDRFFTYYPVNPAKEETVFIHELHRLGGFGGTDKADYAKITKGCGTPDPYAR